MDLNWLAPIAQSAQPQRYAASSCVAPTNFVFQLWDDPVPDFSAQIEVIERKTFVGCGRKRNPVFILKANLLSTLGSWTKKCGSERGTDSGQFFICADCAIEKGYRW